MSILKSIKNDYVLMLTLLFVFISCISYFIIEYFGFLPNLKRPYRPPFTKEEHGIIFYWFLISCCSISIPILVSRMVFIESIFRKGIYCTAKITYIAFFRDRGRIEFEYINNQEKFKKGLAVMKTKETKDISINDEVEIVHHKEKPKNALILSLYSKSTLGTKNADRKKS